MEFIPKKISKTQAKDTGMAIVLVLLLSGYFIQKDIFIFAAIVCLIIDMLCPALYKPAARLWLGFSNIAWFVSSNIILIILFFILVTPVGLFRKMIGVDSMQIKKWKQDDKSAFKVRNHTFTPEELEHPY